MANGVVAAQLPQMRQGLPNNFKKAGTVYAIAFDMDIDALRANYGDPYNNAYVEIRRVMQQHGFTWQQGSVYFGNPSVDAQACFRLALNLVRALPWFAASVRDVRMLRIEELNDLMPFVQDAAAGP